MREHLEEVDAALLSGDLLLDEVRREQVRDYASRWLRVIKEHEDSSFTRALVKGHIEASGPVTFASIVSEIMTQTDRCKYDAETVVVPILNDLARNGEIELYDTGDAWETT